MAFSPQNKLQHLRLVNNQTCSHVDLDWILPRTLVLHDTPKLFAHCAQTQFVLGQTHPTEDGAQNFVGQLKEVGLKW